MITMPEYIERDALMRRIKEIHCAECDSYHGVRCRACWVDDTLDYIDSEPSADVAPVRWQPVFGYEGLYEVNQFGQIRNKDGQIMRQRLKKAKYTVYKKVSLYKNGKYKHMYVHRIGAQAFNPTP